MNPKISIIIPTHKRVAILQKCLQKIEYQTVIEDVEVVVIHDGHHKETETMVTESNWKMPVHYASIEKSQQGTARNYGIEMANTDICLLIGDDIFLEKEACAAHINAHNHEQRAVLGHTTWDPGVGITPVMTWLEKSGWQFKYDSLQQYEHAYVPIAIQHQYTYTSHISIPTAIAKQFHFDEQMLLYGWEDIVWGTELKKNGMHLYYEPNAKALHHHRLTLEDSLARMETLGESAMIIGHRYPNFDRIPKGYKKLAYEALALLPTMSGRHKKAFLKGLAKGKTKI